ncbi:DNA mismatch repair protein, partial [Coemansia helicoidea]
MFSCEYEADTLSAYTTAVKVDDLFDALPVRRRAMVESTRRTLDAIKSRLQTCLLAYPDIALHLVGGPSAAVLLSCAATTSVNQRISQLYGPHSAQALDFVSLDYAGWSVHGSISRAPTSKRVQNVFVDRLTEPDAELVGVAREVLSTSEYMARTNTAPGSGVENRPARARHPMFVLLVNSTHGAGQAVPAPDEASARSRLVT